MSENQEKFIIEHTHRDTTVGILLTDSDNGVFAITFKDPWARDQGTIRMRVRGVKSRNVSTHALCLLHENNALVIVDLPEPKVPRRESRER